MSRLPEGWSYDVLTKVFASTGGQTFSKREVLTDIHAQTAWSASCVPQLAEGIMRAREQRLRSEMLYRKVLEMHRKAEMAPTPKRMVWTDLRRPDRLGPPRPTRNRFEAPSAPGAFGAPTEDV